MNSPHPIEPSPFGKDQLGVFVHGLAAPRLVMKPLQRRLEAWGMQTVNWGYPSLAGDMRRHTQGLRQLLEQQENERQFSSIHLITHSMGSIIARHLLTGDAPRKLGRIVMLGPPNRGSLVARRLSRVLGRACIPLQQLADTANSFVNHLPEPRGYEIGVIAAAHDRVVSVESTHLTNETDHIIIRSGHTSMLFRRDVARLVFDFLRTGRFSEVATEDQACEARGYGEATAAGSILPVVGRGGETG